MLNTDGLSETATFRAQRAIFCAKPRKFPTKLKERPPPVRYMPVLRQLSEQRLINLSLETDIDANNLEESANLQNKGYFQPHVPVNQTHKTLNSLISQSRIRILFISVTSEGTT
jgi:hypothetical protein